VGRLRSRSWETPEGDKRQVVEVEAEEVGPSLRWATATPERASTRQTTRQAKGGGQFNDPPPF
jgi:single-strand DNA-binding protein